MLQLTFSEADKQALHYERYHHPHPRVQQRMEALWLKSQGVPHPQIAQLCAISANTLRSYLKLYQTGGVEALKQRNFHCPQSALSAYRDTIETHVREHPPQTSIEAVAMLETLTGIRRSFCLRCVSGVSLVLRPVLDQSAQRAATFQCARCAPCHHA